MNNLSKTGKNNLSLLLSPLRREKESPIIPPSLTYMSEILLYPKFLPLFPSLWEAGYGLGVVGGGVEGEGGWSGRRKRWSCERKVAFLKGERNRLTLPSSLLSSSSLATCLCPHTHLYPRDTLSTSRYLSSHPSFLPLWIIFSDQTFLCILMRQPLGRLELLFPFPLHPQKKRHF